MINPDTAHPVAGFVARLRGRLDEVVDPARTRPVWAMTEGELRYVLTELATATAQLECVRLQVLAEADRTGATGAGASASAAEWVAHETRQRRIHARSDLKLAQALESHSRVACGMAAGAVNPDQARVIVRSIDRLPTDGEFAVDPEQRVSAEALLVGLARTHDAKELEVLGSRIFEVIAPALAEAYEGRLLEAQEAAAARKTSLTMSETPDGLCRGRFTIAALHGAILSKAILGLASPTRSDDVVIDDASPVPTGSFQLSSTAPRCP